MSNLRIQKLKEICKEEDFREIKIKEKRTQSYKKTGMEDKDKVLVEIEEEIISRQGSMKKVEISEIIRIDFKDQKEKREEAIKKEKTKKFKDKVSKNLSQKRRLLQQVLKNLITDEMIFYWDIFRFTRINYKKKIKKTKKEIQTKERKNL